MSAHNCKWIWVEFSFITIELAVEGSAQIGVNGSRRASAL